MGVDMDSNIVYYGWMSFDSVKILKADGRTYTDMNVDSTLKIYMNSDQNGNIVYNTKLYFANTRYDLKVIAPDSDPNSLLPHLVSDMGRRNTA